MIKKSKFSTPSANLGGLSLVHMNPLRRTYNNNEERKEGEGEMKIKRTFGALNECHSKRIKRMRGMIHTTCSTFVEEGDSAKSAENS